MYFVTVVNMFCLLFLCMCVCVVCVFRCWIADYTTHEAEWEFGSLYGQMALLATAASFLWLRVIIRTLQVHRNKDDQI